jgi:hypothetical protein
MTVTSRKVVTRTVEQITTRRSAVLCEPGGPPLETRHLLEADRQPAHLLAHELRVVCGSLDRTGGPGGYTLQPHHTAWRALRDVGEESIAHTVRRVERVYAGWVLPEGESIHDRVRDFLEGR